ncbi:MAG: GMC family oxidoreductase [Acidobacteria bacterium]|nr:MAG: GMC family oxidoreductase [Acidobacteriota bacterium]
MADKSTGDFGVIVVGSGASGGWAAKRLSEAGVKVALVDAGRPQSDQDFTEHMPEFQLKYRDRAADWIRRTRPVQKDCYACMEYNYQWFANDLEEPYTTAPDMPFSWQGRMRVTGGRTNIWGRVSLRLSDLDFHAASHDGYGEDWPLSYADLAPYYDLVEDYVGIAGQAEGLAQLPDGKFLPPMAMTCPEVRMRERVKAKLGWTVTSTRTANLTRPLNGRAPCHYCGPCERGCVTHSYFNSAFTTVADAVKSGNCTHIPNAMAYKVLMSPKTNRATGLVYIDRITHEPKEVKARAVVLCAQSLESVRILFNSATREYPNGLANSSGVLGHYLMDHIWVGGGAFGEFPELAEKVSPDGPRRPCGIYIPRFQNLAGGSRSTKFLRGFGYQGGGGSSFNMRAPGFGEAFKKSVLEPVAGVRIVGFGECLPRWDNYVAINPDVKDTFGIPVLHFHMTYSENEQSMIQAMADSASEIMEAAGAKNIRTFKQPDRRPGFAIHEVGVARMGADPKKSVLNQFEQTHDIPNLYVMDGAAFASTACQNPTLTIMALAVRSTDHLMEEMKRGNV